MKTIAIIGAGFAGLATAYHLLEQSPQVEITLYDASGPGGGASGVASGLLHAHMGKEGKRHPLGVQALAQAKRLVEDAQKHTKRPVILSKGLVRPAISQEQEHAFQKSAIKEDSIAIEFLSPNEIQALYPWLHNYAGLFLPDAISLDASAYIEGLLSLLISTQRLKLIIKKIEDPQLLLEEHTAVVICTGSQTPNLPLANTLHWSLTKGQTLELFSDDLKFNLPYPLNADKYLIPLTAHSYLLGATYEHTTANEPDEAEARRLLLPSLQFLAPPLSEKKMAATTRSHWRCYGKDKSNPVTARLGPRIWVFSGLGSRGLLLHALLGQRIATSLLAELSSS
jgi:glycine/D-amino acid oxidase-like deaminating enzyme